MVDEAGEQQCPFCKETIKPGAVKCRFCGSRLTARTLEHDGTCPFCKEEIKPGAVKCRHCHSYLGQLAEGRARVARNMAAGGGCNCTPAGGAERSAQNVMRSPQSDWWDCVDYCFLLTLGEGGAAFDQCINYRCGGYPMKPDFEV